MAQLAAKAIFLHYATDTPLAPLFARHLHITTEAPGSLVLFDPCCGEATFLDAFQQALADTHPLLQLRSYGVEMEDIRAAEAKARLGKANVLHAPLENTQVKGVADILFMNPPYDEVRGERVEPRFIRMIKGMTRIGGLLILVLPERFVGENSHADELQLALADIGASGAKVFRFPDPYYAPFKQHAVFCNITDISRRNARVWNDLTVRGELGDFNLRKYQTWVNGKMTWFETDDQNARQYLSVWQTESAFGLVRKVKLDVMPESAFATAEGLAKLYPYMGDPHAGGVTFKPLAPMRANLAAGAVIGGLANGAAVDGAVYRGGSKKEWRVRTEYKKDASGDQQRVDYMAQVNVSFLTQLNLTTGKLVTVESEKDAQAFQDMLLGEGRAKVFLDQVMTTHVPKYTQAYYDSIKHWLDLGRAPRRLRDLPDELLPAQKETAAILNCQWQTSKTATLQGEMSVGKTALSLVAAAIKAMQRAPGQRHIVIVLPPKDSLLYKWEREAKKVLREFPNPDGTKGPRVTIVRNIRDVQKAFEYDGLSIILIKETTAKNASGFHVVTPRKVEWDVENIFANAEDCEAYIAKLEKADYGIRDSLLVRPLKAARYVLERRLRGLDANSALRWGTVGRFETLAELRTAHRRQRLTVRANARQADPTAKRPKIKGQLRIRQNVGPEHLLLSKSTHRWCDRCGSGLGSGKDADSTRPGKNELRLVCDRCGAPHWEALGLDSRQGKKQPGMRSWFQQTDAFLKHLPVNREASDRLPPFTFDGERTYTLPEPLDSNGRVPLARFIRQHYARRYLVVIDEAHHTKAADSNAGYAAMDIFAGAAYALQMTGTIYGGKASSLFALLYRAEAWFRELYTWESVQEFINMYGLYKKIVHYSPTSSSASGSGYKLYESTPEEKNGMAPAMVLLLLPSTAYLTVQDLNHVMPPYSEHTMFVDLDEKLHRQYWAFYNDLKSEAFTLKMAGDGTLMARYVQWRTGILTAPWIKDPLGYGHTWTPADPDEQIGAEQGLFAKEIALYRFIQAEKAQGRKVGVYVPQLNRRDPTPRFLTKLAEFGMKGAVMRVNTAKDRVAYLQQQVDQGADVVFTSSDLVHEGVDLLMFQSLVWWGPHSNGYTVPQANRRHWRLSAEEPCKVIYLGYNKTPEAERLAEMAIKLAAAQAIAGDMRNGLAELLGDEDLLTTYQEAIENGPPRFQQSDLDWQALPPLRRAKVLKPTPSRVLRPETLWQPTETVLTGRDGSGSVQLGMF